MYYNQIVLVEDDPDDQYFFTEAFNEVLPQATCSIAKNGMEALALIDHIMPDLIFTDINMPLLGGIDLLRELNKRSLRTPVIVLSSSAAEEKKCEALGATHFLLKTDSIQLLVAKLQQILNSL
ncbi:response regulator [Chitinophagaceae bacterium MMS25-I14]